MKLNVLSAIVMAIAILFSCQKEEVQNEADLVKKDTRCCIYQATWDEWGRASKGCDGMGLCNFRDCWMCDEWGTEVAGGGYITITGTSGTLTIKLDPNDAQQLDAIDNALPLIVDYDLSEDSDHPDYTTINIPAGTYSFDSSVGDNGGYLVPITVVI